MNINHKIITPQVYCFSNMVCMGISAALNAKARGLTFEVLEQDTLGGTVYSFQRAKIVMTNPMKLPLFKTIKLYDTSKDELLDLWNEALKKKNAKLEYRVQHMLTNMEELYEKASK